MSIELVLADPRSSARESLRHIIEGWGWDVVAEASDAFEAVRFARELEPDVIMLDQTAGDVDVEGIYELGPPGHKPLVVRLIDSPQEHAAGGITILKGVPSERMHAIVTEALGATGAGSPG